MKARTNSSQSTETHSPDPVLVSPHTDGYFPVPSVVGNALADEPFQPQSALRSTWGETLATTSTRLLHEWLDDETASSQSQAGDVA